MTFYTISYLSNHQHMNQLFNYIAIIIFILLIAVMAFLYLRHRLITRYRDLGIIFFSFCYCYFLLVFKLPIWKKVPHSNPKQLR